MELLIYLVTACDTGLASCFLYNTGGDLLLQIAMPNLWHPSREIIQEMVFYNTDGNILKIIITGRPYYL